MPPAISKRRIEYNTWYAFKKDLELILWCHLANDVWLRVKPRKPLPWHEPDMLASLSEFMKI